MSEPTFNVDGKNPFRVDSDEGREVVIEVAYELLEKPVWLSPERIRMHLSNKEAADLLVLLDAEIGDWMRTRSAAQAAFLAGEGSLSAEARAEYGLEAEDEGYDELDPKHPAYAENLRELGDIGRKRERESS